MNSTQVVTTHVDAVTSDAESSRLPELSFSKAPKYVGRNVDTK